MLINLEYKAVVVTAAGVEAVDDYKKSTNSFQLWFQCHDPFLISLRLVHDPIRKVP
jgi:hypothetical protein